MKVKWRGAVIWAGEGWCARAPLSLSRAQARAVGGNVRCRRGTGSPKAREGVKLHPLLFLSPRGLQLGRRRPLWPTFALLFGVK